MSGGSLTGPNGCYCSGGTTTLQSSCSVTATGSSGSAAYAAGGTVNATSCTLQGYYGVRQTSGSIDIERCSVTGTSYGIYIGGQDGEPVIQYNDFAECPSYTIYNSSSSRTVEARYCYTDGDNENKGYEDAEDRSVNVHCYPSYPESVQVTLSTPTALYYGPTASTTSTTATASVKLKNPNLSYGDMPYTVSYAWTSSSGSVAAVSGSGSTAAVTSAGAGSATIKCTVKAAEKEVSGTSSSLTVTAQAPTSVTLSSPSISTIYYGPTASTTTSTVSVKSVTLNNGSYDSSYASFSWSITSGSSYASVSGSGSSATVTSAKGGGTATVQCKMTYGGSDSASATSSAITVTAQAPTSVELNSPSPSTIYYGSTATTTISNVSVKSVTMNNGSYDSSYASFSWEFNNSSSSTYATLGSSTSSSVTVTSKKGGGTATVKCTVTYGGGSDSASSTASIIVTTQAITSVSVDSNYYVIAYNNFKTTKLTASVSINNGTLGSYEWKITSGSSYASLSSTSSSSATLTSTSTTSATITIQYSATVNGSTTTNSISIKNGSTLYYHTIFVDQYFGNDRLTLTWNYYSLTSSSTVNSSAWSTALSETYDWYRSKDIDYDKTNSETMNGIGYYAGSEYSYDIWVFNSLNSSSSTKMAGAGTRTYSSTGTSMNSGTFDFTISGTTMTLSWGRTDLTLTISTSSTGFTHSCTIYVSGLSLRNDSFTQALSSSAPTYDIDTICEKRDLYCDAKSTN